MSFTNTPSFSLDNFEGPLELLLYLIQKEEVDVCDITLQELTQQFFDRLDELDEIDIGAEVLTLAATLLLMKSQKLLPKEEQPEDEEDDPRIEMIQKLIDYCRFKEAAKALTKLETEQQVHFPRAASQFKKELGSGLEELGLNDLQGILKEVMERASKDPKGVIQNETWRVATKLSWFRETLRLTPKIAFADVFSDEKSRGELVVSFLALLELMKHQELKVVKDENLVYIIRP